MKVLFQPSAESDLSSIALYIAGESGFARANAFVTRIERRCLDLGDFPFSGRDRSDIRHGVRTVAFERRVTIGYMV